MDKPTPKQRAEHILEAIRSIKEFMANIDEEGFLNNRPIQSAVQFQFLIIGEAIRYIDDTILEKYNYAWHIPRSFRNFIIHVYHEVKLERVYFATKDLDELEKQINLIVQNEFN